MVSAPRTVGGRGFKRRIDKSVVVPLGPNSVDFGRALGRARIFFFPPGTQWRFVDEWKLNKKRAVTQAKLTLVNSPFGTGLVVQNLDAEALKHAIQPKAGRHALLPAATSCSKNLATCPQERGLPKRLRLSASVA